MIESLKGVYSRFFNKMHKACEGALKLKKKASFASNACNVAPKKACQTLRCVFPEEELRLSMYGS